MKRPVLGFACSLAAAAALAACGGGGGGGGSSYAPGPVATATPTAAPAGPTATPTVTPTTSSQQVVTMALPSTAMGTVNDPTFGAIGGYTQNLYSQALAFAPGAQIMIRNGQSTTPHTLDVASTTSFPANPSLGISASGGSTIAAGFASGNVSPNALVGPFTLTSGTYYVGCAYHYGSGMRTVITVAAGATPGPQATPPAGSTPQPQPSGYGY